MKRLKSYLFREKERISNQNTNKGNLEYDNTNETNSEYENTNKQEILNEFSVEDVEKIPNSNFGLVEVDRAGARSRRFFIEINKDRLTFLSEVLDTSPDISGEINKE